MLVNLARKLVLGVEGVNSWHLDLLQKVYIRLIKSHLKIVFYSYSESQHWIVSKCARKTRDNKKMQKTANEFTGTPCLAQKWIILWMEPRLLTLNDIATKLLFCGWVRGGGFPKAFPCDLPAMISCQCGCYGNHIVHFCIKCRFQGTMNFQNRARNNRAIGQSSPVSSVG